MLFTLFFNKNTLNSSRTQPKLDARLLGRHEGDLVLGLDEHALALRAVLLFFLILRCAVGVVRQLLPPAPPGDEVAGPRITGISEVAVFVVEARLDVVTHREVVVVDHDAPIGIRVTPFPGARVAVVAVLVGRAVRCPDDTVSSGTTVPALETSVAAGAWEPPAAVVADGADVADARLGVTIIEHRRRVRGDGVRAALHVRHPGIEPGLILGRLDAAGHQEDECECARESEQSGHRKEARDPDTFESFPHGSLLSKLRP